MKCSFINVECISHFDIKRYNICDAATSSGSHTRALYPVMKVIKMNDLYFTKQFFSVGKCTVHFPYSTFPFPITINLCFKVLLFLPCKKK